MNDADDGTAETAEISEHLQQISDLVMACRGLVEHFKRGNGQRRYYIYQIRCILCSYTRNRFTPYL